MKLSEVIKAIEDGSKNKFVNEDFTLQYSKLENRIFVKSYVDYCNFTLPIDGWEETKPPRQWSEKELMLFKLFPWVEWISREKNGDIILSQTKPEYFYDRYENYSSWIVDDVENNLVTISEMCENEITTITFEESPIYIGDLKGE